jgi:hypothetical protein
MNTSKLLNCFLLATHCILHSLPNAVPKPTFVFQLLGQACVFHESVLLRLKGSGQLVEIALCLMKIVVRKCIAGGFWCHGESAVENDSMLRVNL